MENLFNEPKQTYRRSNGRFVTREMAYADKQATEKYKRMYLAVVKENSKLKRKLNQIKELVCK